MLTTVDNPFNPYIDWHAWLAYDLRMGYNTSAYLARVLHTSDELSEADQLVAINNAINEVLKFDEENFYRIAIDPSQTSE